MNRKRYDDTSKTTARTVGRAPPATARSQKKKKAVQPSTLHSDSRFLKFDGRMLKSFSTAVHLGFVCLRVTTPQAIPTARRADHFLFGRRLAHTPIDQAMRSFRLVYDEWLHRRPLLTKMATSSVLFGLGDRLAQRVEKSGKTDEELEEMAKDNVVQDGRLMSESAVKTVRMMVWGGLFLSPMMHTWYNLMERVFVGTGKLVAAKKVVADMVFVAPQMPIWFYTSTGLMAGRTLHDALADSIEKQPVTLLANYMLWPAANSVTYGVMPLEYRLLFANCVHLGWACFLSYMASYPLPALPFLPSLNKREASEDLGGKQQSKDRSHTQSAWRHG